MNADPTTNPLLIKFCLSYPNACGCLPGQCGARKNDSTVTTKKRCMHFELATQCSTCLALGLRTDGGEPTKPDPAAARTRMIERMDATWKGKEAVRAATGLRTDGSDKPDPAAARARMIERNGTAWQGGTAA